MRPGSACVGMINYTERITLLMEDVVRRTPRLSFIDLREVLVFGRFGRTDAEGAFATCHCLTLLRVLVDHPEPEPPGVRHAAAPLSPYAARRKPWWPLTGYSTRGTKTTSTLCPPWPSA